MLQHLLRCLLSPMSGICFSPDRAALIGVDVRSSWLGDKVLPPSSRYLVPKFPVYGFTLPLVDQLSNRLEFGLVW